MRIAVIANGSWDPEWGKKELTVIEYLICADGGANSALLSGRIPEVLIGDLDSVEPVNLEKLKQAGVKVEQYPPEKDETDLELALKEAIALAGTTGDRELYLYGATGGRTDHFLGNIALMLQYAREGYKIRLIDPEQEMWIIRPKQQEIIAGSKGQRISLIALSEQAVVTTAGLYYPLVREALYQDSPRGISNVFLDSEAMIQVDEGWLLAILAKG